ncbi:hypothetical protein CGLO_06825 [Colletotrichum gloeosporioides Cg-14]|uniref:Uncharacterized protein n=1 Tax=Colletotrichum gloeosporioides (strain Cg-14) TaxID=1237896 RepID=T0KLA5_COLGC|nr:hypothetical protein CGLO_06825 [Colletotrichum gloeosporioides Cg-14]
MHDERGEVEVPRGWVGWWEKDPGSGGGEG